MIRSFISDLQSQELGETGYKYDYGFWHFEIKVEKKYNSVFEDMPWFPQF